jgi:antitoxin (DNA-binding transcriptional repressor) of toxin-antitoxin stability system
MAKHVIHISEKDASVTTLATLLARVREGAEIVIGNGEHRVAVLLPAEPTHRSISACIAILPEDSTITLDADFAKDVEAAIASHCEPLKPPAWD